MRVSTLGGEAGHTVETIEESHDIARVWFATEQESRSDSPGTALAL
jgi:hypothetical protein